MATRYADDQLRAAAALKRLAKMGFDVAAFDGLDGAQLAAIADECERRMGDDDEEDEGEDFAAVAGRELHRPDRFGTRHFGERRGRPRKFSERAFPRLAERARRAGLPVEDYAGIDAGTVRGLVTRLEASQRGHREAAGSASRFCERFPGVSSFRELYEKNRVGLSRLGVGSFEEFRKQYRFNY